MENLWIVDEGGARRGGQYRQVLDLQGISVQVDKGEKEKKKIAAH